MGPSERHGTKVHWRPGQRRVDSEASEGDRHECPRSKNEGRVTEDEGTRHPAERRPELIGRGSAAGYTGAYREPGSVDIEEVVAVQTARGPE